MRGLRVRCSATSNAAVARGDVGHLAVAFDRFSSPLIRMRAFQLEGEDLRLGVKPLLLLLSPFLTLVALVLNPILLRRRGVLGACLSPPTLLALLLCLLLTDAPGRR